MRGQLEALRRRERDKRRYVKLSVLLLLDSGRSPEEVAAILGLDGSTVYRYAAVYREKGLEGLLDNNWAPYGGLLDAGQLAELRAEVSANLYVRARDVRDWIKARFGVDYHEKSVARLLRGMGMSYKLTKAVPGKADLAAQQRHVEDFAKLMDGKPQDTRVFFNDGVHPQYNTAPERGWIPCGQEYWMPTQAGRQRLNITGAVDAQEPTRVYARNDGRVNSQSVMALWEEIERDNPSSHIVHICDNARYYHSRVLKEWLATHPRTRIMFLPPYSPNLNIIERLWKLTRTEVINSFWYASFQEFTEAVMGFLRNAHQFKQQIESLLTLNFRPMGA